jgi:hypothetical protein
MFKGIGAALILAAATAQAQQTTPKAQQEIAGSNLPPLISSTTAQAGDSPLVRAARRAVAARIATAGRQVISSQTLRRGTVSQASGPAHGPSVNYDETPANMPKQEEENRQALEAKKRIEKLQEEQRIMADEADQGPYGEYDEDYVEGRMTQIPREIESAQKQKPPGE